MQTPPIEPRCPLKFPQTWTSPVVGDLAFKLSETSFALKKGKKYGGDRIHAARFELINF